MPEPVYVLGSLVSGGLVATGLRYAASATRPGIRFHPAWPRRYRLAAAHDRLETALHRAGWRESPERVAVLGLVTASGLAALGLSSAIFVDPLTAVTLALAGGLAGFGVVIYALHSAMVARRRRLTRELVPLLELFLLELGGGGSPLSALGSVTMQIDSEIAAELRRQLITAQAAGTATFEPRLREYAYRMQIPALNSPTTILSASREFGTTVSPGVRALAKDL